MATTLKDAEFLDSAEEVGDLNAVAGRKRRATCLSAKSDENSRKFGQQVFGSYCSTLSQIAPIEPMADETLA